MKYTPITCVWEVTMGCNMRCGHCGSSCEKPLIDELNTEEALKLADMIADLKLSWITLSGGEPLIRKDIFDIVKRLTSQGVATNIITNGWMIDENVARRLKETHISTTAISIDGPEIIHDKIRKPGAFARAKRSFELLKQQGIYTAAITTVSKENINHLNEIKQNLLDMKVKMWQIQLGLPMGNFKDHSDWLLEPNQMQSIVDFCYETALEGKMAIIPADCIGYYNPKLSVVHAMSELGVWDGCNAGINSFGILHNGDILGCTSIRDRRFIEGNIKSRSLKEIWNDPHSFSWRRGFTRSDLSGDCKSCRYADGCLGGCFNTRLTTKGSFYCENLYCTFNHLIKKLKVKLSKIYDTSLIFEKACTSLTSARYQQALLLFERVLQLDKDYKYAVLLKSIAEYKCGIYKFKSGSRHRIFEDFLENLNIDNIAKIAREYNSSYLLKAENI